jgi:hypothetical protein
MSQSSNDALRQYNEAFRRISEAQNASDTSIPPAGCFTLYENNDYKGCKVTRMYCQSTYG